MQDLIDAGPDGLALQAKIKVVGVGGGGSNAVNRMYRNRIPDIEYIAVNTDSQALEHSTVPARIRVGDQTARGLGVGGDPSKGRACHEESIEEIRESLLGADLIFVAAGMGGGTGTGGSPIVAQTAREVGALTVGVVTKPFAFEGSLRMKKALEGIEEMKSCVDTLIVIPNDRLLAISDERLTMENAFRMADGILQQGVQSIAELILIPGEINLDFADVRAVMENAGPAWMAIGEGSGPDCAVIAAQEAVRSPLLEVSINGATGVIFNVTGGADLTLEKVHQAAQVISDMVDPDANIIFGSVTDPKLENEVRLTVIATGFPVEEEELLIEPEPTEQPAPVQDLDAETLSVPPFLRHHPAARRRILAGRRVRGTQS